MPAVNLIRPGIVALVLAGAASTASATLSGDLVQSVSPTSGYVLNQLEVQTDTDWISGGILVQLTAGELLYFSPSATPASVSSTYTTPGSSTRAYGGTALDPINSAIPGLGALPDVASLLDDPPPLNSGFYPATATLTEFDLTWFGPPDQVDDVATGGDVLNLLDLTASSTAFGTWSYALANEDPADDLEVSGVVYHGRFFLEIPVLGDYNYNGVVDAADFTVWRDSFGSTTSLDGDGNFNGVVDAADYTVWRDNFGNVSNLSLASFDAAALTVIPEPGSLTVFSTGLLLFGRRRSRNQIAVM